MKRLVLLASGSGSNVENIADYFGKREDVGIVAVLTNNRNAKVLERCERLGLDALYFNRSSFYGDCIPKIMACLNPDLIVLAGFLWKVPTSLIEDYPSKIINIHPALLPKYGGKGMYGMRVHEAVSQHKESETGITIHKVNADYDEGAIVFQRKIGIQPGEAPEGIAAKVHALEYEHFPKVIESILFDGKD